MCVKFSVLRSLHTLHISGSIFLLNGLAVLQSFVTAKVAPCIGSLENRQSSQNPYWHDARGTDVVFLRLQPFVYETEGGRVC